VTRVQAEVRWGSIGDQGASADHATTLAPSSKDASTGGGVEC
jgi:hypothetical protein